MRLFKSLFLLVTATARYVSYNQISTKFTKKSDIIRYLTKPKFYFKYLDMVEAKNAVFSPKIKETDTKVVFPQEITYYAVTKFRLIPSKLTQIKVHQIWDKKNDKFCGRIRTQYLEFDITIQPILEPKKKQYLLCFRGEIIRKNIIVPEKFLDTILEDFAGLFMKITHTKCS